MSRASVVPVDDDVPPDVAAVLGCAVLTGGGAVINQGDLEAGDSVAVVGLGGVGMAALITALAHEDVTVYAVDTLSEKRERALELGAHEALHPEEAVSRGLKARVVIEAVGHVAALESALALTAPGGRTVTVGLPAPDARLSISPLHLVAEGRTLIGSYLGSALPSRDIPVFVDMWRRGVLPIEALISSSINLEDINAGMDMLADGHAVRQIIKFDEGEPE
ncbi:zinc-binding dehydrogenase [Nocardioides sp. NPDC006273]|uniref:zinc-binding dehydrogenase n=1 Tax=Nocardioides sp. NPDC006273 TaxID=3155598 RepID=UPI0033B9D03C